MDNIFLSINVVLPTFIIILLGYLLKKIKFFSENSLSEMNNVTFKCFLPILLFYNVYKINIQENFYVELLIFAMSTVILSCLILSIIVPLVEKDNRKRGVIIQGIFRSNFVLFAIPIIVSLYGEEAIGVTSLLVAVVVPTYNFLAVNVLEIFRGGKVNFKNIYIEIMKNPLIISSILGLIMMLLGVKLPRFLDKTLYDLSKIATPLALIVLGGSFSFSTVRKSIKELSITLVGKLILLPGIFIPIAILVGFRGVELATLMVMYAAPTAVSSYTMAVQMDADGALAAQQVVFSSAFSVITIFIIVFITKSLDYI